jgi:SAM-dependent methyltransferase
VLVRFVTVGGKIVVFPQNSGRQDWVANVTQNPKVKVFGEGRVLEGTCHMREIQGLKDPLLGIFTRKYGVDEVRKRYWGQHRYAEIEVTSQSQAVDFDELVYADLEAAFDGVAESYDQHILGNQMNVWLRDRSVSLLKKLFNPGDTVLEIGCGTGTETLSLARHGVRVLALDISSRMLGVLEKKAAHAGVQDMVVPVHARPYLAKRRLGELGYSQIDGAYSTYGAINTEPKLDILIRDLHSMIKPGGSLLLGVWNKYCLFELAGYSVRMRPSMVVARLRNPVPVGKSRFCVTTTSYSVGSLDRVLRGFFRLQRVYGVEILLPPSNLVEYLPPRQILGFLKKVEVSIEGHFPWNRLGDHFLGVYSRV